MSFGIRLVQLTDAEAIQSIYAPIVRHTPISFELVPPGVDEMRQRIAKTLPTFPWLVCEQDGEILGYVYASRHSERQAYQWGVDISAYVHERWRGHRIGRALYTSLFALLRVQGFYNVYAGIAQPNPASVALHESMGMSPVGVYHRVGYKLGAWHDVGWWQGTLQEHILEPAPPVNVAAAMGLAGWHEALVSGITLFV